MKNPLLPLKHLMIMGGSRQNFLGARWVSTLVRLTPNRHKRSIALRLLALSPHYFYRDLRLEYREMGAADFREAEFERNRNTRAVIVDRLVRPWLRPEFRVLDLGCGPGFLAKHVSRHVRHVFAADISSGVLACANVINHADNISYILSTPEGYDLIEDASLDFIYSFAVVQHVTDEIFKALLQTCFRKLKPGGGGLFHIVIGGGGGAASRNGRLTDRSWVGSSTAADSTLSLEKSQMSSISCRRQDSW